jgi:hypothetical protein
MEEFESDRPDNVDSVAFMRIWPNHCCAGNRPGTGGNSASGK